MALLKKSVIYLDLLQQGRKKLLNFWLIKSDKDEYSAEDWKNEKLAVWDGVRNHQAKNFVLSMRKHEKVLFYEAHTKQRGIKALGRVVTNPFPDPSQFDRNSRYFDPKASVLKPKWYAVTIEFEKMLNIDRSEILETLIGNKYFKSFRLSIVPLTREEFFALLKLNQK